MKNARRKKKKRPKKVDDTKEPKVVLQSEEIEEEETKRTVLESLVEAFSIEEAAIAYADAGDKASEILRKGFVENADYPSTCSSSAFSSSSCSGVSGSSSSGSSSEGFVECFKEGKKKVVASTGTVSTLLGKGYVGRNCNRNKGFQPNSNGVVEKEEAEQFLCSMLGNDSDLSLALVRDVLCE